MTQIAFASFVPELTSGEASWISPWVEPGFGMADVVPSWNARTPPGSWIDVRVQGRDETGETPWYELGRWCSDHAGPRTSVAGQADGRARVDVDTLTAAGNFDAYRLRVDLRGTGTSLSLVAAVASGSRAPGVVAPSGPSLPEGIELAVPSYSQRIHAGHLPEFDGGGASWCSAASTAMLVASWGRGPTDAELAWVGEGHVDACVDHAARGIYDHAYGGCGNWPFNTAYAATFGLEAFVTRLRSLREAEAYLSAGIPLAASIAAGPGELDGFVAEGSTGHIVVIHGLTLRGDPVVNDPAAPSNGDVRRVYDRGQFERAWLGGSGGIVYVIRPPEVPLPG